MRRQRSVKRMRSFSSGVRKMFPTAAAGFVCAMLLLDAAPGRDNLLTGPGADLQPADRDGAADLAVGEDLRRTLGGANDAGLGERFARDLRARRDALEVGQPDDLLRLAERVREAALRHAPRERHLAALELRLAAPRT